MTLITCGLWYQFYKCPVSSAGRRSMIASLGGVASVQLLSLILGAMHLAIYANDGIGNYPLLISAKSILRLAIFVEYIIDLI